MKVAVNCQLILQNMGPYIASALALSINMSDVNAVPWLKKALIFECVSKAAREVDIVDALAQFTRSRAIRMTYVIVLSLASLKLSLI